MLLAAERRRLLGAFVRSRREALPPSAGGRRRTPGLRREEVALSCGISTAWYSWIEQGRDIALSPQALARLAEALRMSAAERAYLFDLALQRDPTAPAGPSAAEAVPADLVAAVRAIGAPAYLLDRLWRARAWNAEAGRLFAPWLQGPDPCLIAFVFRDPAARSFIVDWEERARRVIAEFRADTARTPEDPALVALVAGLRAESPDFARLWEAHAVALREGGARRFRHPEDGLLAYEQVTLLPTAHPDPKIVMLLPTAAATA
jgi:transcriptional regulator with XRE-family HTH domain